MLDKMDALFRGTLSESEEQSLRTEIETNSELKAEFNLRKVEHEAMNLLVEDDLRSNFEIWENEKDVKKPIKTKVISLKRLIIPISLAASFLLIIGFFIIQSNDYSNELLAARYYTPDFSTLRSIGDEDPDAFVNVENILKNKIVDRYPELEQALKNIPTQNLNYTKGQFYLGHLYYDQNNNSKAISAFDKALENTELKDDAQWFKALALLKNGITEEAKTILSEIGNNPNHKHVTRAKGVLNDMDSFWRKFRK